MSNETAGQEHKFSPGSMVFGLLLMAVFDIGIAIAAFQLAKSNGASDQLAYLISGVGPLLGMAVQWIRSRNLSVASLVILLFIVLSAAAAFIGGADSRLLIVKDSVVTGGFGVTCLISMLLPKPLMFYFGARFGTDGTKDGLARWNSLWQYPTFRRSQYVITATWGIGFLVEALFRIAVAYTVSNFELAFTISQTLPFVFIAVLVYLTISIANRSRKAGAIARKAQEAQPSS